MWGQFSPGEGGRWERRPGVGGEGAAHVPRSPQAALPGPEQEGSTGRRGRAVLVRLFLWQGPRSRGGHGSGMAVRSGTLRLEAAVTAKGAQDAREAGTRGTSASGCDPSVSGPTGRGGSAHMPTCRRTGDCWLLAVTRGVVVTSPSVEMWPEGWRLPSGSPLGCRKMACSSWRLWGS